jgi:hypothetical protein
MIGLRRVPRAASDKSQTPIVPANRYVTIGRYSQQG